MGFHLGAIADQTDAGILKGMQREIACDCWFTSNGKTIPQVIKIMDEMGGIHTIKQIRVLCSEEKIYSGIQTVEHICQIPMDGRLETVKLVFTKENCKWTIVQL